MDRNQMIGILEKNETFDVIVIGGGASGLGCALDAVSRGYKTCLFEKGDFAGETSSQSSKLIHGGLRYLKQGRLSFVFDALRERSLLFKNAPHLVHPLPFIIPTKNSWEAFYTYAGVKLYDLLARGQKIAPSHRLSRDEMLKHVPFLPKDIHGGICYFDGQFDDARLAITLAHTIVSQGGCALNYFPVQHLIKKNERIGGVFVVDDETKKTYEVQGRVVINATGAFVDLIQSMENGKRESSLSLSQGTHIVLPKSFYPSDFAIAILAEAGRLVFVLPWKERVIIGTTDVAVSSVHSKASQKEVHYLLEKGAPFLTKKPCVEDLLSVFSGIRPLIKGNENNTAALSRDHSIEISTGGLVTVRGGKWTTYRKMGEEVISVAALSCGLPGRASKTQELKLHGYLKEKSSSSWQYYGSDLKKVESIAFQKEELKHAFHSELPLRPIDVLFAIREEMARRLDDVLSRRSRSTLLGAKLSWEIAPEVVKLMAFELNKDLDWQKKELFAFKEKMEEYLPSFTGYKIKNL